MATRIETGLSEQKRRELTARRERECPLEGPNSLLSGLVRRALEDGDLGSAQSVLDHAEAADRLTASNEILDLLRHVIEPKMAEGGMPLTDQQKTALLTVGPDIYLAGLYHGRAEGAHVIDDLQQEAGGD